MPNYSGCWKSRWVVENSENYIWLFCALTVQGEGEWVWTYWPASLPTEWLLACEHVTCAYRKSLHVHSLYVLMWWTKSQGGRICVDTSFVGLDSVGCCWTAWAIGLIHHDFSYFLMFLHAHCVEDPAIIQRWETRQHAYAYSSFPSIQSMDGGVLWRELQSLLTGLMRTPWQSSM